MAEHLSEFALEGQLTGEAPPNPHLESCARCQERVETLRASSRELLASPASARTLSALDDIEKRSQRARPRWRPAWWLLSLPAVGLAAALLVFYRPPVAAENAIKGHPTLAVVRAATGEAIHRARPGDRVALQVGGGEAPWLIVLAVDDASGGKTQILWPSGGNQSAPAPSGAAARLSPEFTITPGSLSVRAIFSARPLTVTEAADAAQSDRADSATSAVTWEVCVEGSPCPSP